jgi:hypothetical protein
MPDRERHTTVTEVRGSDERLADAFQALGDTDSADVPEDLRDRIWLAVSGALSPEERRDLVERTATDPGCAEAWRVASEMWRASQARAVGGSAVAAPGLTRRWTPRWLAMAAALLLVSAIGVISLRNQRSGDEFRASSGFIVESLVPADMALPRDAFRLRWTPGPEGSRYQLRATTEDLQVLATAADLTAPEFVIERAVLSGLPGGASVFWQVDVSQPNGERLTSSTFITRVE